MSSVPERAHPWSPCTKEEMWEVYDVFRFFSKGVVFAIKRRCFFDGLRDCVSIKRLDVVRRTQLRERFRDSAQDVTLEEFLRMYLPSASDEELKTLIRWSHLREAQLQLQGVRRHYSVTKKAVDEQDSVLRTIFALLDVNGDGRVSLEELQFAEILSAEDVETVFELAKRQNKANETKAIAAVVCGRTANAANAWDSCPGRCDPVWDQKLSYRDFCVAVKSRTHPDQEAHTRSATRKFTASVYCTMLFQNPSGRRPSCGAVPPM